MTKDEKHAYEMGKDSIKGANIINCHFAIFSTHQKMKAWERGRMDGDKERKNLKNETKITQKQKC